MLTITKIQSASNAASYYSADTPGGQQVASEWQGTMSEQWALAGPVVVDDLEQTLNGWSPGDSKTPLVRHHVPSRISAIDCTFKAPKSISIAAIALDDARLLNAHREAVTFACLAIERDAQARVMKNQKVSLVTTGNLAIAKFEHTLSRLNDPHLHTHCVAINATKHQGRFVAWYARNLFKKIKQYGAVYRDFLAGKLQALGYALRRKAEHWELAHIPDAVVKQFSKRQRQIDEHVGKGASKRHREIASLITRPRKKESNTLEVLRAKWVERFNAKESGRVL